MTEARDPTDADIEDRLRQAPQDRWPALWAAVDEVDREDEHTTWGGGEHVGDTIFDGVERPVIQMPYAIHSDASQLHALYDLDILVPFKWPGWEGSETYRGGTHLESATVADALRIVSAIIQADRFTEGTIGATLDDGTLQAALVERHVG